MFQNLFDERPTRKRLNAVEKKFLFQQQSGKCMYCGIRLNSSNTHADHKTPIDRDGSNNLNNFQLLCMRCNTRKGDLTDGEFRRAYRLTPARQAKGPPTKRILDSYFDKITKERQERNRKRKRRQERGFFS